MLQSETLDPETSQPSPSEFLSQMGLCRSAHWAFVVVGSPTGADRLASQCGIVLVRPLWLPLRL